MNLVLQRRINALRLPETVRIVIAENPDATMAGFTESEYDVAIADAAIKDRTVRLVMTTSTAEWLSWARSVGLNSMVVDYLTTYPERLSIINRDEQDLHPTPRAWERVAKNLDQLAQLPAEIQKSLAADLFSGDLGTEVGASFAQFVLAHGRGLTVEELQTKESSRDEFRSVDDATKLALLRDWIRDDSGQPLSSEAGAQHFGALLAMVSPDGQYALAQSIGERLDNILQPMYERAKEEPAGAVAQLYQQLAVIATRGDNR
jgi:hypothetical protein